MTWAKTGAKQVSVVGVNEKCAFTLLISITVDGTLLPFQAIYIGLMKHSCSWPDALHVADLEKAGFCLKFLETKTYWSNHETMHAFVDHILAPYFDHVKVQMNLSLTQKSLRQIDVWSVYWLQEFQAWMTAMHPTIILNYVPGGCTGVLQPCAVHVEWLLKLSMWKR